VTGERDLISRIRARLPADPPWVRVGIGDDAAVVEAERNALEVLTTDTLVEGVHWDPRFCSAADVGHKALAVNLSDMASMGAQPRAALLSLSVTRAWAERDSGAFIDALAEAARAHGVAVVGGNVTSTTGPATITLTLTGTVRPRRVLTRSGARAGDELYVTGGVGAALAGLRWLQAHPTLGDPEDPAVAECVRRYRRPDARVRLGRLLGSNRVASACMDLSDGLADAVRQVALASGTGARIDAAALPIPDAATAVFRERGDDPVRAAVEGGDDYELLVAVPPKRRRALEAVRRLARGATLTRIGELTKEPALVLVRQDREETLPEGFAHF
jgi:thiamine-monophosphate kinase